MEVPEGAAKDNLFLSLVERIVPGLVLSGPSSSLKADTSGTAQLPSSKDTSVDVEAAKIEEPMEERPRVRFLGVEASESKTSTSSTKGGVETRPMSKLRRSLSDELFNERMEQTYRETKELSLWKTLLYAYQTLGVVYGDLGTSPLYVYPTITFKHPPNEADYLGILSLIFWTLTLVGVLKYTFIVLDADDHGEGGTFALYSFLCQHVDVGRQVDKHYKRLDSDKKLSYFTRNRPINSATRRLLEGSQLARKILLFVVMMGTCMIIGDGILTPAISGFLTKNLWIC